MTELGRFVGCFILVGLLAFQFVFLLSSDVALGTNGARYDLLILCHEDFVVPLRRLAEWKSGTGMPATVCSWQTYNAYTGWGRDAPERIKTGIEMAHATYGVKYVMLVGDSDMFPVRYMMTDRVSNDSRGANWLGYGAYYACDLYYADLYKQNGLFDDWDFNDNNLYGELRGEWFQSDPINWDRIDMIPDVAVGRLPAASRQDVENYVEKVIAYEQNTYGETRDSSTKEWFESALFIVPYSPADDLDLIFYNTKESIASSFLTPTRGFQVIKLYDSRAAVGAATVTNGTPAESLIKYWMNKGVGFVNYGGHGNRDAWDGVFFTWSVNSSGLYNRRLPTVFSTGCGTAKFAIEPPYEAYEDIFGFDHAGIDNGELWPSTQTLPAPRPLQADVHDSFPEVMLCQHSDKGAIAYVGCITGAQAWSKFLDYSFFEAYEEGVVLGDMWSQAITAYCDDSKILDRWVLGPIGRGETLVKSNGDWFYVAGYHQPMKFMLFGDPSLRVGGLANHPPRVATSSLSGLSFSEGTAYTFNAADYGFSDPEGAPLSYRWDFNGDGAWDTDWSSSVTVTHVYSDNTRCSVKVQASDGVYQSEICGRELTVANVAPTVNVYTGLPFGTGTMPCYRLEENKQARFEAAVFDPGADTFTYSWSFGEGADPQTSNAANPIVTFEGPENVTFFDSAIRTYYVNLTVRDDDGGATVYRLTMEIVHLGLLDRLGGILGLMGISIAVVVIGVSATWLWRMRLSRKGRREYQRPP